MPTRDGTDAVAEARRDRLHHRNSSATRRIEAASATPTAAAAPAVAPEPRPRDARGMGAAIVLGDDLDVLVTVAPVQFVLDAEVGEVDAVVEVRQVVLARPAFDLARDRDRVVHRCPVGRDCAPGATPDTRA